MPPPAPAPAAPHERHDGVCADRARTHAAASAPPSSSKPPPDEAAACAPTSSRPSPLLARAALDRAWIRFIPRRARLPAAALSTAIVVLTAIVAPVYFGGYARGGTVTASSRSAWDVGYAHTDTFPTPDALLAAVPFDPATQTLLRASFRQPQEPPPPDAPAAAFDAYILAITYIPRYETAAAAAPPSSIALGLALYSFGIFNNGSRLASCCGYDGMALQFNGVDMPIQFNRSIPWVGPVQETMLIPVSPRASLSYFPYDRYIAQAAVDMSFTINGTADVYSETHIPWGVVVLAPPTSLDVRVSVVLESHVPVPFVTVKFRLQRTTFTKVLSVFVCCLMWMLALCVFSVSVDVLWIRPRGADQSLTNMSAAFAALFALTPLRNTQVGIPPPMIAVDMWSFFWCMTLVAVAAAQNAASYFAFAQVKPWVREEDDEGGKRGDGVAA